MKIKVVVGPPPPRVQRAQARAFRRVLGEDGPDEDVSEPLQSRLGDIFGSRIEGEDEWVPMPDWIGDHG